VPLLLSSVSLWHWSLAEIHVMILIVEVFLVFPLLLTNLLIIIVNFWLYDLLLFIMLHPPVETRLCAKHLKEILRFFLGQLAHFIFNISFSPTLRLLINFKVTIDHEFDSIFKTKRVG